MQVEVVAGGFRGVGGGGGRGTALCFQHHQTSRHPSHTLVPERNRKQLIVVGDRVLIEVEEGEERSKVGLYLPPSALDSQAVQGGRIVATGPGTPMPSVADYPDEPWRMAAGGGADARYVPMQARVGDYALFFRKASVEITFEHDKYLVVPQSAILALVREPAPAADDEDGPLF